MENDHELALAFENDLVRLVEWDWRLWFNIGDVCRLLEIEVDNASARLEPDERGGTEGQLLSESGVYRIIYGSRKPRAKRFREWCATVAIPSARKSTAGGAAMPLADKIRIVEAAERIHGKAAARALWREIGLPIPTESQSGIRDVGAFLGQCVERCPGAQIPARALYGAYVEWARSRGLAPVTETAFGRSAKKLAAKRDTSRSRVYVDIRLCGASPSPQPTLGLFAGNA